MFYPFAIVIGIILIILIIVVIILCYRWKGRPRQDSDDNAIHAMNKTKNTDQGTLFSRSAAKLSNLDAASVSNTYILNVLGTPLECVSYLKIYIGL